MAAPDPAQQIARWMKAARQDARLTTYDVAGRMGITQSRASRLERGLSAPTPALVRAWAKATGGDPARAGRMADTAASLARPRRGPRPVEQDALTPWQREMALICQAVTIYSELSSVAVPSLLQVPAYATGFMELLGRLTGRSGVAAAVAQRMNQQEILYDASRTFQFLVTESALGLRAGPPDVMTAQAEKIISTMTLPNVTVGVLPASATLLVPVLSGFIIYEIPDDPLAVIELLPGEVTYSQSGDVGRYQDAFRLLQGYAVTGRSRTISLIRSVMCRGT